MKKIKVFWENNNKLIMTIVGIIFIFFLWFIISLIANSPIIPHPIDTFRTLFILLEQKDTYFHIGSTLLRLFIGLLISLLLGLIFGILSGVSSHVRAFLKPLVVTLRTIPTASIILILISITKFQYAPIYVTILLIFPLIYEAVVSGLTNIDQTICDALKVDGDNEFKSLFKVKIPLASPMIKLGFVQSLGLGMKVMIMSEIISGNRSIYGLGFALRLAQEDILYKEMFAYTLIAIFLVGMIDIAIYLTKKFFKKT